MSTRPVFHTHAHWHTVMMLAYNACKPFSTDYFFHSDFVTSSLSFDPPRITSPTSISLTLTADTPFGVGDIITLSLPGFNNSFGSGIVTASGSSSPSFRIFWDQCAQKVFMTALSPMPSSQQLEFIFPESLGILLPRSGIRQDDPSFTLTTNAIAGAASRSINSTQPVFSFSAGPSVYYDPPIAGAGSNLTINFTATMDLIADDEVSFTLSGFTGVDSDALSIYDPDAYVNFAQWRQASQQLTLSINTTVLNGTAVSVTILDRLLALSAAGVAGNSPTLKASVSAAAGSVVDFDMQSPPVGSFTNTVRVRFSPPKAGSVTSIILFFTPQMTIFSSETVELELANFLGDNNTISTFEPAAAGEAQLQSAGWSSGKLSLTFAHMLPAKAAVHVRVPASLGVRIPVEGTRQDLVIKISTQAIQGPVLPVAVTDIVPIGGETMKKLSL